MTSDAYSTPLDQVALPVSNAGIDLDVACPPQVFQVSNNAQMIGGVPWPPAVLEDDYAFPDIPWWDLPIVNPWDDASTGVDPTTGFAFAQPSSSENGPYCLDIPRQILDGL